MSERMRIAWTICAIAAVGIAAFIGLRALASGSGQSMRESGLVVPSQSGGAAAQSDPGTTAPPAPPAGPPAEGPADPAPGPVPAPVPTAPEAPYQVTPSQPQRATSDDDDDHDDHDDDHDDD